jgi:hypothetical protein
MSDTSMPPYFGLYLSNVRKCLVPAFDGLRQREDRVDDQLLVCQSPSAQDHLPFLILNKTGMRFEAQNADTAGRVIQVYC